MIGGEAVRRSESGNNGLTSAAKEKTVKIDRTVQWLQTSKSPGCIKILTPVQVS